MRLNLHRAVTNERSTAVKLVHPDRKCSGNITSLLIGGGVGDHHQGRKCSSFFLASANPCCGVDISNSFQVEKSTDFNRAHFERKKVPNDLTCRRGRRSSSVNDWHDSRKEWPIVVALEKQDKSTVWRARQPARKSSGISVMSESAGKRRSTSIAQSRRNSGPILDQRMSSCDRSTR